MTKQGRYKQSGEQSKKNIRVNEKQYTGKKSGCPISKKCGGCQYIDKSYAEQLKIKTDQVKKLLAPYGSVDEIIGMKEPYHYRNKGIVSGRLQDRESSGTGDCGDDPRVAAFI